jgi:hypothetical protein
VNGLEFGRARLEPFLRSTGSFEVVIEHRLLGFFALHDDFDLELRDGCMDSAGWHTVSVTELKNALVQVAALRKEEKLSSATSAFDELADWEPEISTPTNVGFIPRIPVEGDTKHIERAKEALAQVGIRNRILGGIGSRRRIWGHVTFLVASPRSAQVDLLRAGFVQSPESKYILIDSTNGWKICLLAETVNCVAMMPA